MNEQISNKELANNLKLLSDHFLLAEDGESVLLRLAAERLAAMPDTCMKREVTQYKWSCGCVSCVCDTDIQCLGCGATSCRGGNCQRKNVSVEAMTDAGEQEPYCHIGKNAQRGLDEKGVAKVWKEPLNNNGDIALYTQPQQPPGWSLHHNPKPVPDRSHDWDFAHVDYDYCSETGDGGLAGTADSPVSALKEILEIEFNRNAAPDKEIDLEMEMAVDSAVNNEILKEEKVKFNSAPDKETLKSIVFDFCCWAAKKGMFGAGVRTDLEYWQEFTDKYWQRQSAEGGE